MAMDPSPERVVRFQNFELSVQTGELRKSGRRLKITGQPVEILLMLLERPGQLVTREEIQNRLWPGTLVDVDHNLHSALNKIGDALGDAAESPRFLETIPRRGYRFIASVTNGNNTDGNDPDAVVLESTNESRTSVTEAAEINQRSAEMHASHRRRWLRYSTIAFAIVVVLLSGWIFWSRQNRNKLGGERRVVSNAPENPIRSAIISPDGKFLAYQDKTGIFIKAPGNGETHAAQGPEGIPAHVDGWFPDSSNLLITRQDVPHPSLWRGSMFNGPAVKLIEDASSGSVSPDGSQIAFHRYRQLGNPQSRSVWISRLDGSGETQIVPEGNGTSSFWGLAWS